MNVLEKDLEDVVWATLQSDPQLLRERGLRLSLEQVYYRQVRLGAYGIADIVGVSIYPGSNTVNFTVIELKKEKINTQTLLQSMRYATALESLVGKYTNHVYSSYFSHVLIGKEIDTDTDFCYALNHIGNVNAYTYTIDLIKGLRFTRRSNYTLVEENLPTLNFSISDLKSHIKHGYF